MKRTTILSMFALCAYSADVDVYAFGLSYHRLDSGYSLSTGEDPRRYNPGLGTGIMWQYSPGIEIGAVSGWYRDSYNDRATFAMPMVRLSSNRWSIDAAAGYFDGSCWDGIGGTVTAGFRVAGPVWVHAMYYPAVFKNHCAVGFTFLRVRI